jgi:glycosyltransferase involved in cell wall biosynthesis
MSLRDLRIVHVVDNLNRGGLERVVFDLSIEQMRRGFDVSVYCLHVPGSLADELAARGVPVQCGHKRRGPDLRVVRQLRALGRGKPNALLHAHSMMPNYYACAARLLAGLSFEVVNTRHDMGSTRPDDPRERLYRLSVPLTRLAIMVSRGVQDRFIATGIVPARKARLVMNGIHTDCPQHANGLEREAARRLLSLASEHLVIGCIGRLVTLKNQASALRVFARAAASRPDLRLVLIGDGPLRKELEALSDRLGIAGRVCMPGERSDIRELLPALDLFVMPSLTEGHSIALLEAMAAGSPIIATRVGGNAEIVTSEHSGLLVPPDDDDALLAAMLRMTDDRELRARVGAQARNWALAHVSVGAMADAYETVYAEALGLMPAVAVAP